MIENKKTYYVFFRNLSNPLKVKILLELRNGELSVNELKVILRAEQSKISHALSMLRKCNLVSFRKKGKFRYYSLNRKIVLPLLSLVDNHAKFCCNCKSGCGCFAK